MSKESQYEHKSTPADSLSIDELKKNISALTEQVINSYRVPTQTGELGSRLSQLHNFLVSGLLKDEKELTDTYFTCASSLLTCVLGDSIHSEQQQLSRKTFASQRCQQTLFFQVVYWALLRPWLFPSVTGSVNSYHDLEQYLQDLRQRPSRTEKAKLFDDFNTRIQDDIALSYAWECCLQALQSLPHLQGWKRNAQIFQALIRSSVHLPDLPDLSPSEIKTAWGLVEKAASLGSNMCDYKAGHPNPNLHLPIINIQVTVYYALQDQSQLPPLHLALSCAERWQVFWAVTVACETVLCSPRSTYQQCRQAMGDLLDSSSDQEFGLFALINYWLSQPPYSGPECHAALAQTLRHLLDPSTRLPAWLHHFACYAWAKLQPRLTGKYALEIKAEIEKIQKDQELAWVALKEKSAELRSDFQDDEKPLNRSKVKKIHEQVVTLKSLLATDLKNVQYTFSRRVYVRRAYRKVKPTVETWSAEERRDFYQDAGKAYGQYARDSDGVNYPWLFEALRHYQAARQIAQTNEMPSVVTQEADLIRLILNHLAYTFSELLTADFKQRSPFAHLPLDKKDPEWAEAAYQALVNYSNATDALHVWKQDLSQWALTDMLISLRISFEETYKAYKTNYTFWKEKPKSIMMEEKDYASRKERIKKDNSRLQEDMEEKVKKESSITPEDMEEEVKEKSSITPASHNIPWQNFSEASKQPYYAKTQIPWLTNLAKWLNERLPLPPCAFDPFVVVKSSGQFLLGIELADSFRHHPFFSHWAEWFKIFVSLYSNFIYELDVSAVSHLSCDRPSSRLLDAIGTRRELLQSTALSAAHWRYQTSPMVWIGQELKRPLDLHGHLKSEDKTGLRPHAVALNLRWQHYLNALTTNHPDEKVPIAQLRWLESKEPRYLSTALTCRLFQTEGREAGQLARDTRSFTPGQCDVWCLTAADACQPLPGLYEDTLLAYLKANPYNEWRQWQHLSLMQRLIDYGHTGTIASLQYGQVINNQFQPQGEPIPIWLSSPAGLTFCTEADNKGCTRAPDIQVLDPAGEARFKRYVAQLDPRYFTQVVFLTWLLVHEDDQLRNLGFESFINAQGRSMFRIIPFDTDTCLETPWIRLPDGNIQIKLKSLIFCLDAMRYPLDESAIHSFLELNPEMILKSWLTYLSQEEHTFNQLPLDSVDQIYQRWQRLIQVLQLPLQAEDPMAPTLPCNHLELLRLLDPLFTQAYTETFDILTDPLQRFHRVSQDYLRISGTNISTSTGLLRGESVAQPLTAVSTTYAGCNRVLMLSDDIKPGESSYLMYIDEKSSSLPMASSFLKSKESRTEQLKILNSRYFQLIKEQQNEEYELKSISILTYEEVEVPGEGDCLYSAVGMYIEQDREQLRGRVADELKFEKYKPKLKPQQTLEQYIEGVRNGSERGGDAEIMALMQILQRQVIVVRPDEKPQRRVENPTKEEKQYFDKGIIPILVRCNDTNHYKALILVEQDILKVKLIQLIEDERLSHKNAYIFIRSKRDFSCVYVKNGIPQQATEEITLKSNSQFGRIELLISELDRRPDKNGYFLLTPEKTQIITSNMSHTQYNDPNTIYLRQEKNSTMLAYWSINGKFSPHEVSVRNKVAVLKLMNGSNEIHSSSQSFADVTSLCGYISMGLTPLEGLARCLLYHEENQHTNRLVDYLVQQVRSTDSIGLRKFKTQINNVVVKIQKLNPETQAQREQRLQEKSLMQRAYTSLKQWQQMIASDLSVELILKETSAIPSLPKWQSDHVRAKQPGIRIIKTIGKTWQINIHNGDILLANRQLQEKKVADEEHSEENSDSLDLQPFHKIIMNAEIILNKEINIQAIRQTCQEIYRQRLNAYQKTNKMHLANEKERLEQRQNKLLRQQTQERETWWYQLSKNDANFLKGLSEIGLRQTIVTRLPWGRLPVGKGLEQLLRLLKIGGLTALNLQDCTAVTDDHVIAFIQNSPNLMTINLSGCLKVTSLSLLYLEKAKYLERLSARSLPKLTNLGRHNTFRSSQSVLFPQLTHADFRDCINLSHIYLQAPALKHLYLGLSKPNTKSNRRNPFYWTLITPALQTISIKNSTNISRLKIESTALEQIDMRGGTSMTLSLLQGMIMLEQWAGVNTLQLEDCPYLKEWEHLSHYPFLVPLAQHRINIEQLSTLHTIFSDQAISVSVKTLSYKHRLRLQTGLAIFFSLPISELLSSIVVAADNLDNLPHRLNAVEIMGYIGAVHLPLADKMIKRLVPKLDYENRLVCIVAIEAISRIVIANPEFSLEAIEILFMALESYSVHEDATQAIRRICIANPVLTGKFFEILVQKMSNPEVRYAPEIYKATIKVLEATVTEESLLPVDEILKMILPSIEENGYEIRNMVILILGRIGSTHLSIADIVLDILSATIRDKNWRICCASAEALQIIGVKCPPLSARVLEILSARFEEKIQNNLVHISILAAIGRIDLSVIRQHEHEDLISPVLGYADQKLDSVQNTIINTLNNLVIGDVSQCNKILELSSTVIKETTSPHLRSIIINTLSKIGVINPSLSKKTLKILYTIEHHEVAEALGNIGAVNCSLSDEIVNKLIELLYHNDPNVCGAAAKALGIVGFANISLSEKIIINLIRQMHDVSPIVRQTSTEAIAQVVKVNPTLITSHVLKELIALCNKREIPEKLKGILLLVKISCDYHLCPGQTLKDFIDTFLKKSFTVLSTEDSSTDTDDSTGQLWSIPNSAYSSSADSFFAPQKEDKVAIPLDAKYFLHEQKLIPFIKIKMEPDGNCLFHSIAYGINHLESKILSDIRVTLKSKEQSGEEIKDIDDKLLRGIVVKLLNDQVKDAKLAHNLVEQGLVPLVTLDEEEYADILKSVKAEDREGKLYAKLESIRTNVAKVAEVKDKKSYRDLIAKNVIAWAEIYRDLLGIPQVWGGPVELRILEDYLGIRLDMRQQLNLRPLSDRLVKYEKLKALLTSDHVVVNIKDELKAALHQLVPLDKKARRNLVGSDILKLLEKVLSLISKPDGSGGHAVDTEKLDHYLTMVGAVELYCDWFRCRKVLNSELEQEIYHKCLIDKYSRLGLTLTTLKRIQEKGISVTDVYCDYNTDISRLEEVTSEKRIQVIYTGAHYDIVQSLPNCSPISLSKVEIKASSALPPPPPPTPPSAGGQHSTGADLSHSSHYSSTVPDSSSGSFGQDSGFGHQRTAASDDSCLQTVLEFRLNVAAGHIEPEQIVEAEPQKKVDFDKLGQCLISTKQLSSPVNSDVMTKPPAHPLQDAGKKQLKQAGPSGLPGMSYRLVGSIPPGKPREEESPSLKHLGF